MDIRVKSKAKDLTERTGVPGLLQCQGLLKVSSRIIDDKDIILEDFIADATWSVLSNVDDFVTLYRKYKYLPKILLCRKYTEVV